MTRKSLTVEYEEYESAAELQAEDRMLFDAAVEALSGSYAPYSKFNVGAAVRLEGGIIVKGANQENAAYPSGICAERTAMFAAGANWPGKAFEAIAIVCAMDGKLRTTPGYPCGACRQVMSQYERESGAPLRIILGGAGKIQIVTGVASLLPFTFDEL